MADQKKGNSQFPTEDVMMGQDVNVPYDMTVPGEEDTAIWDNMVQALKPNLTPHSVKQNKQEDQKRNDQNR
jgi:hypothetical protein